MVEALLSVIAKKVFGICLVSATVGLENEEKRRKPIRHPAKRSSSLIATPLIAEPSHMLLIIMF
jgi:hypothetical protein